MKHIAICLFFRNLTGLSTELWFQKRQESGPLDGYLEFPGGKIELTESPREACVREVQEELAVPSVESDDFQQFLHSLFFFKFYTYEYPDRKVKLYVFLSPTELSQHSVYGEWISLDMAEKSKSLGEKILPANGQIIDDVLDFLAQSTKHNNPDDAWRLLSQSQSFF